MECGNDIIKQLYRDLNGDLTVDKIFSKCGMRCDLCLIYRPNVNANDRRKEICGVYSKMFQGYNPDPNTIICDGCSC